MEFDLIFMLFLVGLLLAALIVVILARPGPKKTEALK